MLTRLWLCKVASASTPLACIRPWTQPQLLPWTSRQASSVAAASAEASDSRPANEPCTRDASCPLAPAASMPLRPTATTCSWLFCASQAENRLPKLPSPPVTTTLPAGAFLTRALGGARTTILPTWRACDIWRSAACTADRLFTAWGKGRSTPCASWELWRISAELTARPSRKSTATSEYATSGRSAFKRTLSDWLLSNGTAVRSPTNYSQQQPSPPTPSHPAPTAPHSRCRVC